MKLIKAIIRSIRLNEIKAALNGIGIEQIKVRDSCRIAGEVTNLAAKVRLEVVAADELMGRIIEIIGRVAGTERTGDCRIFILPFVEAT
jgi:nitrogen regulatory protein PII